MPRVYYERLTAKYFKQVIALGNHVYGDGYLNEENIKDWTARGIVNNSNCGYVALVQEDSSEKLVGFRITFAAQSWKIDQ